MNQMKPGPKPVIRHPRVTDFPPVRRPGVFPPKLLELIAEFTGRPNPDSCADYIYRRGCAKNWLPRDQNLFGLEETGGHALTADRAELSSEALRDLLKLRCDLANRISFRVRPLGPMLRLVIRTVVPSKAAKDVKEAAELETEEGGPDDDVA